MLRQLFNDEKWAKLKPILLAHGIYDKPDLRQTVEGMFYRIRVGCPWRDLPEVFGPWNKVYKRFRAWSQTSKWLRIFEAAIEDPDLEWLFIDGTYIKAHQHSTGAPGPDTQAIGQSRGGATTQIHMSVDAYGLPSHFVITGGQTADCSVAPDLIDCASQAGAIVGDKGYDSEDIRQQIEAQESQPVIPRRRNSTKGNEDLDQGLYRYRHLVENLFAQIKHFRGLATRFDKLKQHYEGVVAMVCTLLWLPMRNGNRP
jgi:transposase